MNEIFIKEIKEINKNIINLNASLKNLNTMKLDGEAKYLIKPTSFIELKRVLNIMKKYNVKYHVIGNGSNIIFTSKIKECLIKLNFNKHIDDRIVFANELVPIKANDFYNKGYEGLEYLSMIPASFGGAIYMNASSYNHSISDIIEFVYYLDEDLKFRVIRKEECLFSYRKSLFKNSHIIILGCKVRLIKKDKVKIKKIMDECKNKRKETQPIEYPSSGSIFQNGKSYKAWELIDKANLKGYKSNGAMISDKHCNFIVNYSNASYNDVIYLINLIENKVKKSFGITLEREIIILD